ncbi:hypothetical protein [Amycolatopsis sp. MtRt-6]|uniref:hypothetical protein n=1 Tax=Amycolatopsis sp. MtRt-6 TaxID=2792782 RepID=UPI001A8BF719
MGVVRGGCCAGVVGVGEGIAVALWGGAEVGTLIPGAALGQSIQQRVRTGAGLIIEPAAQFPDPGSFKAQEQFPGGNHGFGAVGGEVSEDAGTEGSDLLVPGLLGESQQVGLSTHAMLGRNLAQHRGDHIDHRVTQPPRPSRNTGRGSQPGGGAVAEQLHHPALFDFHQHRTKFGLSRPHARDQLTDAVGKSHRLGGESRIAGHTSKLPAIEHRVITRSCMKPRKPETIAGQPKRA